MLFYNTGYETSIWMTPEVIVGDSGEPENSYISHGITYFGQALSHTIANYAYYQDLNQIMNRVIDSVT